jgi:hypothetical protein
VDYAGAIGLARQLAVLWRHHGVVQNELVGDLAANRQRSVLQRKNGIA